MSYKDRCEFSCLLGKTLVEIKGLEKDSYTVLFKTSEGERFKMDHDQDCCENVRVEDVIGDVSDLIGATVVLAEESTGDDPDGYEPPKYRESFTWTFYRLATTRGHVDIRWLGESNGCYSEAVYFERLP